MTFNYRVNRLTFNCVLVFALFYSGQLWALLGSGALHFMPPLELKIEEQHIWLGLDEVRVKYVIVNHGLTEITSNLVFALPENTNENTDYLVFTVNQQVIEYKTLQRAVSSQGIEVSGLLQSMGIPLNPIAALYAIEASANRRSILEKLRVNDLTDKNDESLQWYVKTFYYWLQTIRAGEKIVIEQRYRPQTINHQVRANSASGFLNMPIRFAKKLLANSMVWVKRDSKEARELQGVLERYNPEIKQFCPQLEDYEILVAARTQQKQAKKFIDAREVTFEQQNIFNYALPIGVYSLHITTPKNMHPMLCWCDRINTNDKQFIFTAKNYVPTQDVKVLYVEK